LHDKRLPNMNVEWIKKFISQNAYSIHYDFLIQLTIADSTDQIHKVFERKWIFMKLSITF